ncbi:hypothetical protein ABEX25_07475 [Paenibacillus thiaminolyticus]|uniref:hypothetical protein n=1 Tax=Paenibacillus thiaminolyticus TaxID=49283 RepID=UPI003D2BE5FB
MNLLFGGTGIGPESWRLLLFIIFSAGLGVIVVGLRKDRMQSAARKPGEAQLIS